MWMCERQSSQGLLRSIKNAVKLLQCGPTRRADQIKKVLIVAAHTVTKSSLDNLKEFKTTGGTVITISQRLLVFILSDLGSDPSVDQLATNSAMALYLNETQLVDNLLSSLTQGASLLRKLQ